LIPEILSEAVLGTKEVNEKARDAGFDLLVVMGNKMAEGGSVTRTIAVEGEEEDGVGQEGMFRLLRAAETPRLASPVRC